jgi:hypothetical protein
MAAVRPGPARQAGPTWIGVCDEGRRQWRDECSIRPPAPARASGASRIRPAIAIPAPPSRPMMGGRPASPLGAHRTGEDAHRRASPRARLGLRRLRSAGRYSVTTEPRCATEQQFSGGRPTNREEQRGPHQHQHQHQHQHGGGGLAPPSAATPLIGAAAHPTAAMGDLFDLPGPALLAILNLPEAGETCSGWGVCWSAELSAARSCTSTTSTSNYGVSP